MSNETYLIGSYFTVGLLSLGIALAAYQWLRRPMAGIADALPQENWKRIIRRGFPLSTILFVLASCLSVSYYGCAQKEYAEIVSDRSYVMLKNSEQISKSLDGVIWGVGAWSVILAVALRLRRRGPS